jgi:hypothetical protein
LVAENPNQPMYTAKPKSNATTPIIASSFPMQHLLKLLIDTAPLGAAKSKM